MRWCDDDPIRETGGSAPIVAQDGMRDDRRRGEAIVLVDHHFHAIGCEDFKDGHKGRIRECVGVFTPWREAQSCAVARYSHTA